VLDRRALAIEGLIEPFRVEPGACVRLGRDLDPAQSVAKDVAPHLNGHPIIRSG
jgi:hypothetical protein